MQVLTIWKKYLSCTNISQAVLAFPSPQSASVTNKYENQCQFQQVGNHTFFAPSEAGAVCLSRSDFESNLILVKKLLSVWFEFKRF
jgi:hypothetical protein